MAKELRDQAFEFNGQVLYLQGSRCHNCRGIFFLPRWNLLEFVHASFCPFCGMRFTQVVQGNQIQDLNPQED